MTQLTFTCLKSKTETLKKWEICSKLTISHWRHSVIFLYIVSWEDFNHLMLLVSFYTPWKNQKARCFLMFSGGQERDPWHEMGQLEGSRNFINIPLQRSLHICTKSRKMWKWKCRKNWRRGSPPLPFLKIGKKCPDFGNKIPWSCSSVGWISLLKCCFKGIYKKKIPCGAFLSCAVEEMFIEVPLFQETSQVLINSRLRPWVKVVAKNTKKFAFEFESCRLKAVSVIQRQNHSLIKKLFRHFEWPKVHKLLSLQIFNNPQNSQ